MSRRASRQWVQPQDPTPSTGRFSPEFLLSSESRSQASTSSSKEAQGVLTWMSFSLRASPGSATAWQASRYRSHGITQAEASALQACGMETSSDAGFSLQYEDGTAAQCDGYLVPHSPCIVDDGEFGALRKDRVHRLAVPQLAYVAWVEEQLEEMLDTLQQRMDMQQRALEQRLERLLGDKCAQVEQHCRERIQDVEESYHSRQTEMKKELEDVKEFLSTSLRQIESNVAALERRSMSDSSSLYSLTLAHAAHAHKAEEHTYKIESLMWSLSQADHRFGLLEEASRQSLAKDNHTDLIMENWQQDIIQQVGRCVDRLDKVERLISSTGPGGTGMPRGESTERRGRDRSADSDSLINLF